MSYLDYAFTDVVSGKMVNHYYDDVNRVVWLAEHRWALFRVKTESTLDEILGLKIDY